MKNKIISLKNKLCYVWHNLSRQFDFTLSFRRKKQDEKPLVSVNVKGEIPREVVAFFALLGAFTAVCSIIKLIKLIKKL